MAGLKAFGVVTVYQIALVIALLVSVLAALLMA